MKLECPHCGNENEIETIDWPQDCSTAKDWECVNCDETFSFGVTAEIELR